MRQKVIEKLEGIFLTPIDSDAVFHEESEYVIRLMIYLTNDDVSSVFRRRLKFFPAKNRKKLQKLVKLFQLYISEDMVKLKNLF